MPLLDNDLLRVIFLANEYGVAVAFNPTGPSQTQMTMRVTSDVAGLSEDAEVQVLLTTDELNLCIHSDGASRGIAGIIHDGLQKLRELSGAVG